MSAGKAQSRRNDRQLYETADNVCQSFIMAVVDETWYKELEDPGTFYTKVTALKLLDHLTEFCSGLHTVDAVDILQVMKTLYKYSKGYHYSSTRWSQHRENPSVKNSSSSTSICTLWRCNMYSNLVSTRLKPGSSQNSRRRNKPGRSGRNVFERHRLLSNNLKPLERKRKNRLEALHCLERHQSHKTRKRRRKQHSCRTKCLILSRDTWTTLRQRRHKQQLMEARWWIWQLVWRYPWIRSLDSN